MLASYDDGDVARFGPGAAHLRDLIGYAIGRGCRRFDFTIGDERYKLEWSDHTIRLYDYIAPASPRGWLMSALILTRRRLARLIKQNPLLWNAFGRMRAMVGGRRAGNEDRAASGKSPPIAPA